MIQTLFAVEKLKLRRRRAWLIVLGYALAVTGLSLFRAPQLGQSDPVEGWLMLIGSAGFAVPMVTPIIAATLSSTVIEPEHAGQGWQWATVHGVGRGTLMWVKLAVVAGHLAAGITLFGFLVPSTGALLGLSPGKDQLLHWVGYVGCAIVATLLVAIVHVVVASVVANQLANVGIALVGTFFAIFASALPGWLAQLMPWSWLSLTSPADFVGTELHQLPLPYAGLFAAVVIALVLFTAVTISLNKKEL